MRKLLVVALSLGSLLTARTASPQGVAPGVPAKDERSERRALGVGVALGAASMGVGGESRSTFAVGVVARLGLDSRNRVQLIGEYYPTKVDSPILDESFATANALLGFTFGRDFKLRLVAGAQFRRWTGSQRVTASDWGPVIGLDAGPELRLGNRVSISPELVLRLSLIEAEGNVNSKLFGLQCVVSWRGGS
jgi:hypothetical protein